MWGATSYHRAKDEKLQISIHAPRVGSDYWYAGRVDTPVRISIHAPRVGSDSFTVFSTASRTRFQSTLPVWGATINDYLGQLKSYISIHAPRVGSDQMKEIKLLMEHIISIHAPRVGSDIDS